MEYSHTLLVSPVSLITYMLQIFPVYVESITSHFTSFNSSILFNRNIQMIHCSKGESEFFQLLCATRDFHSTDSRDKIYALLRISEDPPPIASSYVKDVADVFEEFTTRELLEGSLEHLAATNCLDDATHVGLQSWVLTGLVLWIGGHSRHVNPWSIPMHVKTQFQTCILDQDYIYFLSRAGLFLT